MGEHLSVRVAVSFETICIRLIPGKNLEEELLKPCPIIVLAKRATDVKLNDASLHSELVQYDYLVPIFVTNC